MRSSWATAVGGFRTDEGSRRKAFFGITGKKVKCAVRLGCLFGCFFSHAEKTLLQSRFPARPTAAMVTAATRHKSVSRRIRRPCRHQCRWAFTPFSPGPRDRRPAPLIEFACTTCQSSSTGPQWVDGWGEEPIPSVVRRLFGRTREREYIYGNAQCAITSHWVLSLSVSGARHQILNINDVGSYLNTWYRIKISLNKVLLSVCKISAH